jgi:hypothetical protein
MIKVDCGTLKINGSKPEIMADLAVAIHSLIVKDICTLNDIDVVVAYAKKSDPEIKEEYEKTIKENKKELMEAFSSLLDDLLSE